MGDRMGGYGKSELELMTTYQLREICFREKIMNGVIDPLDKEELIRVIWRFMGKRTDLFIERQEEAGKERLEELFRKCRIEFAQDVGLHCSSKIVAYEGLSIEWYDGYTIPYRKELAGTNAFLIGSDMTICTIFNLREREGNKDRLYITKTAGIEAKETQRKDYRIFCMERRLSEVMYAVYTGEEIMYPEYMKVYSIPLIDFVVRIPATLMLPIAIDFGSVNTAVGVYLDSAYFEEIGFHAAIESSKENEISYTKFEDGEEESILLPSVIGVASVEENEYRLLFGYDALRLASASYIDGGFCIFYDIKRWVGEYNKEEEIVDRLGRRRFVRRAELLQHFFQYIIQRTENRFKCRISQVHLSSPVKQKYYFKKMFESILPKYQINSEGMLDEGMAVLYNTIAGMIERKTLEEGETYEALMIDCGGGTTDLCSYRFCVENRKAAYRIDMKTTYENGDTDFGGNNLTYRIMQLLKIALAHSDQDVEIPGVKAILESMDTDVYRFVDTQGVKAFYRHLDEVYEKAEKILPTRFADYEQYQRKEYYKVKNNFYTLFDLAEQIKKRMYGRVGTLKVIVTTDRDQKENGSVLMDKWKLSFYQGEELLVKKEIPEIIFNYFEIELLLSGEIYGIVRKFMEGMYQTGRLMDFSFIRLTGQSCKIALFKDALKEFVPGRMIQFRKRGEADSTDIKLKLSCVDGAIKYLRDKKYGTADIHQDNTKAVIPYRIMGYTHSGKEVTLVDGFGDWSRAQTVSRHLEDMVLSLYLQDGMGEEHWKYRYICKPEDFRPVTYEQISEIYGGYILQKETDSIENGDVKFFLWAKQEEWGFQVVPVCCREDELYLGKAEFFHFESDSWINNFFDGRK